MKILFISPYLPSPLKPRSLFFLKNLLELGNSVEIFALEETGALFSAERIKSRYNLPVINAFKLNRLSTIINASIGLLGSNPLQVNYCRLKNFELAIKKSLESRHFDIVHVENIRAIQFINRVNRQIPIIFDAVDCMSYRYSQFANKAGALSKLIFTIESKKLRIYEQRALNFVQHTIVTTQTEKERLLEINPTAPISVIPNGVNFPKYRTCNNVNNNSFDRTIFFWGKMDYLPNKLSVMHLVKNILPIVKRSIPQVKLRIIGANPDKQIKELNQIKGVSVNGFVEDITSELNEYSVGAFPLLIGTGMQNKLLEAIAYGIPVVCSSLAAKPLNLVDGKHAFIRDNNESFANAIVTLFFDNRLKYKITNNALRYVKGKYAWEDKTLELENIYKSLSFRR